MSKTGSGKPITGIAVKPRASGSTASATYEASQTRLLEMLATGRALEDVLNALLLTVEGQSEGMLCSVLWFDEKEGKLRHLAAPSLPPDYNKAVDGIDVGPSVGSCGTAAYRGERVLVENTLADPLWADFRDLALKYDLRACWSQPIFSSDGELMGTFAMYYREPRRPSRHDIDVIETMAHLAGIAIERKRGEQALQDSEMHLRQVLDLVPHMIFAKDRKGDFILANAAVADAYGTSVEELVGRPHAAVHPNQDEVAAMLTDDLEVIESGRPKFVPEEEFTDRTGKLRLLQTTKIPFRQSVSNEAAILGVAVDITERRKLERQLSFYEDRLETLFLNRGGSQTPYRELWDLSPDYLLVLGPEGTLVEANRALRRVLGLGRSKLDGRDFGEFVAPSSRPVLDQALALLGDGGGIDNVELELLRPDGTTLPTRLQARAEAGRSELRVVLRDVLQRKSLQRQLHQTEQLVTTGRLAASVAHAINNPLQAVLAHLSVVSKSLPDIFPEHESWERVTEGMARIQHVVNDLLDLNRVGRGRPEPVDINAVIDGALGLLDSQFQACGVEVQRTLEPGLPRVVGVPQHLYQVVLNLLLNGVEAMEEGGLLRVTTRSTGKKTVIEIQDSGRGIAAEDLPQVFDPMFTVRGGKGTGLGLFVTQRVIREHDGEIEVQSGPGKGTLIRILLPAASPDSAWPRPAGKSTPGR